VGHGGQVFRGKTRLIDDVSSGSKASVRAASADCPVHPRMPTFRCRAANRRCGPCVDGSGLARVFFTYAALVGAAMCSAFERGTLGRWP
jgi:hypothetical protein